jgi:hypothetical protein
MTGAVHDAEDGSRSVIHFGASMKAPKVRIEQTWLVLGMRGSGSNDVVIDDAKTGYSVRPIGLAALKALSKAMEHSKGEFAFPGTRGARIFLGRTHGLAHRIRTLDAPEEFDASAQVRQVLMHGSRTTENIMQSTLTHSLTVQHIF